MTHNTLRRLFFLSLCFLAVSCGVTTNRLQRLPAALPPGSYPKTAWLSTMEQTITPDKNAVYASLPLAWESLRQKFGETIYIADDAPTLQQIAHSAVDRTIIEEQQFHTAIQQKSNTLSLAVAMDATLHFDPHFEYLATGMKFDSVPVHTFGMSENSFDRVHRQIEIHRYRDDDHFIIGLLPTDRKKQVLLYKTDKKYETLADMYTDLQNEIQHGRADMTVPDRLPNYSWTPYDRVAIPRLALGVQGEYPQLSGSTLRTDKQRLTVAKVEQTVAFLLNETGTKLAIETDLMVDMDGPPRGRPQPKKLIMDKPFYIIVRQRGDDVLPYLVLWINNTELLEIL